MEEGGTGVCIKIVADERDVGNERDGRILMDEERKRES
jgi:hypothetical protein